MKKGTRKRSREKTEEGWKRLKQVHREEDKGRREFNK